MAKLYYGNGEVTIEGSEIRGIDIRYRGSIKIEKKTGDNFALVHANNRVIIFPLGEGYLNELFYYSGTMKIISLMAVDNNSDKVPCTVKRVMDYSELLDSTSETMTIPSEDLSSGYSVTREINETPQIIENLFTKETHQPMYLADGTVYVGYYHVHHSDGIHAMTGRVHDENSQDLYYKKVKKGKVLDRLIPTKQKRRKY